MLDVITNEAITIKKKLLEVADRFVTHIVVTISQAYNYLQFSSVAQSCPTLSTP